MDPDIRRLMKLFEGYAEAFGTYDTEVPNDYKNGKLEIKSTARTVRAEVTLELWQTHVKGLRSLGIIPIRDNATCLWGCIDVDKYDVPLGDIATLIENEGLPLVVCRSKSGGAHLFLFLANPVPADRLQTILRQMSVVLGFGDCEVFPVQRFVDLEKGELASWLNMPYYGGNGTERYAVKTNGLAMTLSEFLDFADSKVVQDIADYENVRPKKSRDRGPPSDPDFGDGPPCLQHLVQVGFMEGTRNAGLFELATFAKKKYPQRWEEQLEVWNYSYMQPPLPSSEVVEIIKSHRKKEYFYRCKDQPICSHCNSAICRTRKFGVGGDDDFPVLSGLRVLDADPPLWFVCVDDVTMELSTVELQNFKEFHRIAMERLFICYRMMKQDAWLRIVSDAMKNVVRMDAPQEVGKIGHFYELLEEFLTNRHAGRSLDDLLLGRPFESVEEGKFYFRLQDLQRHLDVSNFRAYNRTQIATRLRMLHGDRQFFNIKGKGTNCWFVPSAWIQRVNEPLDTPPLQTSPI
jgi:hypothetical protein